MFEARLEESAVLKKILDSVRDLVQEANWDCNDDGIVMQSMDSSHISLVCFMVRASSFEVYQCERNVSLGVKIDSLAKVLKCAAADDSVTLKADENEPNTMDILFESKKNDRISDFQLKLMVIDQEMLGIPESDYRSTVEMSSAEFRRIMGDLSTMGDSVTIEINKGGASFSTKGDIGSGNICLQKSASVDKPKDGVKITMVEPVKSTFSLKFLNIFAKAAALSDTVVLSMSEEYPIRIEFAIDKDVGYVRYYLAPKIEGQDS
uniref:DNA sliding clamp PCNA n=1 Tax=Rhodosorus marinus TaxID=101924 RepID=A0A7S2ZH23_9RHOD|mmetsp:Transcript_16751/g.68558  ORF Transcript_16751/g.68558 Transcript_16751/m.68558 type:complete len:263 (+) Transcript_16751:438-1226(+)